MTTREPNGPATPQDPTESWTSAETSELPAHPAVPPGDQPAGTASAQPAGAASAQPAGAASVPPAQSAGQPTAPPSGSSAAYASVGGGPGGGGYGPPVAPHGAAAGGGRPGFWRRATSTTGGIVALVAAGVIVVLLVVGVAGAAAFAVGRGLDHHGGPRVSELREGRGDGMGPGMRGQGERGPGEQQRQLGPQQRGMGGNGGGLGSVLGGAGALGAVQHGEFTVTGSGGTPTVMTLQRGTVTAASSTSLSVKSADGFTATYALDSSTRAPARTVANGDSVLVLAQKQGSKAVLVRLTR